MKGPYCTHLTCEIGRQWSRHDTLRSQKSCKQFSICRARNWISRPIIWLSEPFLKLVATHLTCRSVSHIGRMKSIVCCLFTRSLKMTYSRIRRRISYTCIPPPPPGAVTGALQLVSAPARVYSQTHFMRERILSTLINRCKINCMLVSLLNFSLVPFSNTWWAFASVYSGPVPNIGRVAHLINCRSFMSISASYDSQLAFHSETVDC